MNIARNHICCTFKMDKFRITHNFSSNSARRPSQRPTTNHYHPWLKNAPKLVWVLDGVGSIDNRSSTSDIEASRAAGRKEYREELIEALSQATGKPEPSHENKTIAKDEYVLATEITNMDMS